MNDRPHARPGPTTPADQAGDPDIDLERLCVAARSVLAALPEMLDAGVDGDRLQHLAGHAGPLADLSNLEALPLASTRQHADAVTTTLAHLGSDSALTMLVWFEDALAGRDRVGLS